MMDIGTTIGQWVRLSLISTLFASFLALPNPVQADILDSPSSIHPTRVLVVYNANYIGDADHDKVQDSLESAKYYAEKRGIPSRNILGIKITQPRGYSSYSLFQSELIRPLKAKLNSLGQTNIDVILFGFGMPYLYRSTLQHTNVSIDNIVMALWFWNPTQDDINQLWSPYFDPAPGFDKSPGHFHHTVKFQGTNVYLVSRLESPLGITGVLNIIDQALYGEKFISPQHGYYHGNVYVDCENRASTKLYTDSFLTSNSLVEQGSYGFYNAADLNIAYSEHYTIHAGLPLKWERTRHTIGEQGAIFQDHTSGLTAPNALLYGGWDNLNHYITSAWQWLPGSLGIDIDSTSLSYSITPPFSQQYNPAWGVNALANGLTATCGSVGEPDLASEPRPNIFLYYILNGYSFAEAGSLSSPVIGWMPICIGDPMYTPFGAKTAELDTLTPTFVSGYPFVYQSVDEGNVIKVMVDDTIQPKTVLFTMDYGTTTAYGQTMSSPGYLRRYGFVPIDLLPSQLYHYRITATDPAGNSTQSEDLTFTTPAETPYGKSPFPIPGNIPFYQFDNGGEGVAYHDVDITNLGPHQPRADTGVEIHGAPNFGVNETYSGEWLNYTVQIASTRNYSLQFLISDYFGSGGQFHIEQDGVNVTGTITIPNLGGKYGTFSVPNVPLTEGQHILRLVMDKAATVDGWVGTFSNVQIQ